VRHNVTINNILPGQFMTDRLKTRLTVNAKEAGVTLEQYLDKRSQVIPAGRFGDPSEFGELCAYVCSVQAAFITGQNFLIDGGTYPGTY
jgi:3-oxoacyl-[acyl-carrier protein] reductase